MIPTPTDYWRALILYGKNSSTYKIALGRLLLNYSSNGTDRIDTNDLAGDFFDIYHERCSTGKPQLGMSGRKTVVEHELDAIAAGVKQKGDTLETIRINALQNMVLQRFNVLNNRTIRQPFFHLADGGRYLALSDGLLSLSEDQVALRSLNDELVSRWDLLEYAFEHTHRNEELDADELLNYIRRREERTNLTGLIPTLNGYQQGRCFYCGEELYETAVDHVIPYQAVLHNQIWNLVLAHSFCNENKSDNLPPLPFVENLIARNEYFIASAHPIKDTLIQQLGRTPMIRRKKSMDQYMFAKRKIGRIWGGSDSYDPRRDNYYREWVNILGTV